MLLKSSFLCVLVLALVSMPLALGFQQQNQVRVLSTTTTTTTTTTRGIHSTLLVGASPQPVRSRKTRATRLFLEEKSGDNNDGIPSTPLDRPVLSLIDCTMLFIFAAIGKASHASDGSLDVLAVLVTAFPFLLSWFLTAPFLGCFTPMATGDLKESAIYTAKGWAVAIPLGCVLRGLIKGYVPPIPFVVVTLLATLVLLGGGRAAYTAMSELFVG
jgi:hypothetical protein